jgi:uncharacterized protein YkwD
MFLVLTVAPAGADTVAVTTDTGLMRQLASELNATRREAGKPGLRYSQPLALAAATRAKQLAAQGWADKPLSGIALQRKIRAFYAGRAGETVLWASGKMCGSAVVYYWLDKLRDKTTVLSSKWTEAGIAAVRAGGDTFVVVEYGTRT